MSDLNNEVTKKRSKFPFLHLGLFILTFITCMMSGTQWLSKDWTEVLNWHYGLTYAILILTFLSAHEFGHYFASKYHKVDATLPYYIPFPFTFALNFGTFGAVIKMRSQIPNRKALFDIGVAGPIAGFVVAVGFLIYGLYTLPGISYLYNIHPEYITQHNGNIPQFGLYFGDTLSYSFLSKLFANPNGFLPPMNEIYHYPFLNVGWFGLFVTTLNMLPMGQLDGGHITYAMFGEKTHSIISKSIFYILLGLGLLSIFGSIHQFLEILKPTDNIFYLRENYFSIIDKIYSTFPMLFQAWSGWLIWAFLAKYFIKLKHPPIYSDEPIGIVRMSIGWLSLIILLLSFSYSGLYFIE